MNIESFKIQASEYAAAGRAFLFLIDFEMKKPMLCLVEDAKDVGILYHINGNENAKQNMSLPVIELESKPISREFYTERFRKVKAQIDNGNSYLLNLTFATPVTINIRPEEIFYLTHAPYRMFYRDEFVVFSPECFIKIIGDEIFTYPMKGTIDANKDDAENKLLNNQKEEWEHNTIVDLMRNDLSVVAHHIEVKKYRFIQKIRTHKNEILQTSSEISGKLNHGWQNQFGEILISLLPAGSVSGAPKMKTLEIIESAEEGPRGYYTGVFGIFDGENVDSAVAIRFIETKDGRMLFRSGGGITAQSKMEDEYQELIQKVYVPAF